MKEEIKTFIVSKEEEGLRADVFLSRRGFSRSEAEKLIKKNKVTIKNILSHVKPSYKVQAREKLKVFIPPLSSPLPLKAFDFEVPVLFEDKHLLVINKPAGLVSHPGEGHAQDTLVNALIAKGISLSPGTHPLRPGIVHRLDKAVSGLMALSKTEKAQEALIKQFKLKEISRSYRALCVGLVKQKSGRIKSFVGRHPKDRKKFASFKEEGKGLKEALTFYRVVRSFQDKIHWLECRLQTGRTHQIRLHLSSLGLPILGDELYGLPKIFNQLKLNKKKHSLNRVALYAFQLEFLHPITGKGLKFYLPWPEEFKNLLNTTGFLK